MKYVLCIAGLLAAFTARADGLEQDALCTAWARNATIGGEHALMGHARRLVPMKYDDIIELIEHQHLLQVDGIPVFVEDHAGEDGRAFLEDSVFYGFDYVKRTPHEQLPGSAQQMLEVFHETCRSNRMTSL